MVMNIELVCNNGGRLLQAITAEEDRTRKGSFILICQNCNGIFSIISRMSLEHGPKQLNKNNRLGPIRDICVVAAQRAYLERKEADTNPQIVQMVLRGKVLINHWYYRSDQWVEQPYFIPFFVLQPYRGPANYASPILYGQDTYIVDERLIELTDKGYVVK
jgi:hypothetical protein